MAEEPTKQFLALVQRVHVGTTARSENDLSSKLAGFLDAIGLHTVIDTHVSSGGRKRPDVLAYVSEQDADLVLPAELVIESKKPDEVEEFRNLIEAMVSDRYWPTKTYPYLRDNISRVQYFVFTTFTEFAAFAVIDDIRAALIVAFKAGDTDCVRLRKRIAKEAVSFRLYEPQGPDSAIAWVQWTGEHFKPSALAPVPLSSTRNSIPVEDAGDLERLATRLATFAAGTGDPSMPEAGLFQSIRGRVGDDYAALPGEMQRDLLIFIMSQHPGLDTDQAKEAVKENPEASLDEFVAASIHSLMSRLFAVKVIEDVFCVGQNPPLIEPSLWIFATDVYDIQLAEAIRTEVFRRIRGLRDSANPVVRRFASYGFFFDWIEQSLDPVLFRSLVETFAVHDFTEVEGDLLGRFYELYAQQINRSRRKALGQYYTPLSVVQFMWQQALSLVEKRGEMERVTVLDPAMGSATFLAEGARALARAKIPNFWERLTGFDIAAQVLGIANINVYMAALSQLTPDQALAIQDLRLYATDALDYQNGSHMKQILPLIPDEAHRLFLEQRVAISTLAKRQRSYRLIIGNPPYRNNSSLVLQEVSRRFPRLLASSVQHGGAQRRNIRDDYAWFVAAADFYVQDAGIISFILSDSFASNRSYEHFRAELIKNYHVRNLVRLGSNIFPDVGYRTSFAIILLEKRAEALATADLAEAIPYTDLRPLATDAPASDLGTPDDPRLSHLRTIARGKAKLEVTGRHSPTATSRFSFYPGEDATSRYTGVGMPVHEKKVANRLFLNKWPGIITAFDVLFKGKTRDELEERFSSLFELCSNRRTKHVELERRLEKWGAERHFKADEIETLKLIGARIQQTKITYDTAKIKRSFSGSIPEDAHWYPPAEYVHYLYYETALSVPRNENPGKKVGWGTMNQWRDPLSHTISPKLIFTTASRRKNGFAAFVADDEWYVKLHGGTSQQFNYTGLDDPTELRRMDGLPSNLSDDGLHLYEALTDAGGERDTLLYYVAGVWNSELAAELLDEAGSAMRPGIKHPGNDAELKLILKIAEQARTARDVARMRHYLPADTQELEAAACEQWASRKLLKELGFKHVKQKRRGFQDREYYTVPADLKAALSGHIEAIETQINEYVEFLYP